MKILLLNAPNTLNYGSMMLAENFITYFDPGREHEFLVVTDKPEETVGRLTAATGHTWITAFTGSRDGNKLRLLAGVAFPHRTKIDADLAVVLGGDDFTEDHGWRALISQLLRINMLSAPVCFVGQSMGPFFSFRKPVCKFLLSRASRIYIRDSLSFADMHRLGLRNIIQMPDLAFAPLNREDTSLARGSHVCFFPSELIWLFSASRDRDACLDFYAGVLTRLSEQFETVWMLPHVLAPDSSDDRKMTAALSKRVERGNIRFSLDTMMPFEVRALIRSARLVVTGRMHPAVSSVACGTPVIAFSYSAKYHGVIAKDCGLERFVIDVRDRPFSDMAEPFNLALSSVIGQEEQLREQLAALSSHKRNGVLSAMEDMRKWYLS